MIISLSGYAHSGKDTAGKMIQEYTAERTGFGLVSRYTWEIRKWADALRKVAHIFLPQFTLEFLYTDEFKEMELEGWDYETQTVELDHLGQDHTVMKTMTGRQFLQWLGTDAIRNGLHREAWVKAMMAEYHGIWYGKLDQANSNWIITDTRFPNELKAVKAAGGYTIRLQRLPEWITSENEEPWRSSLHESETALDSARFDFTVKNNGTLDELRAQLETIMTQITHNEQGRQTHIYPVRRAG